MDWLESAEDSLEFADSTWDREMNANGTRDLFSGHRPPTKLEEAEANGFELRSIEAGRCGGDRVAGGRR
jgi:hypothetical protein